MSKYSLIPGCYSLPLGSDLLWHLANHLSSTQTKGALILLPTDRAIHRLNRILYKLNPEILAHTTLKAYDELASSITSKASTMPQILWSLIDDPQVLDDFFFSNTPTTEQKQQLCSALNATLSELFTHEIDHTDVEQLSGNDASTRQLSSLLKRYNSHIKKLNTTHPATALNQGVRLFHQQLTSIHQTVYLIIDGPIPLSLQQLALALSTDHFVWIYGDPSSSECQPHDLRYCYHSMANRYKDAGHSIHPLPLYAHRKPLIDELQRPVYNSRNISGSFKNLHFIESKDAISLAHHIVKIAKASFSKTVRIVSVVTPNRVLAKIIHHTAVASNILVDDSCGISLHETNLGSVLLSLFRYFIDPTNYKLLLDILMHPMMLGYWRDLPLKLDEFGRRKQVSFMAALQSYTPDDDIESEHLLELIRLTQPSIHRTFDEMLTYALDTLRKWNINANEFPEYKIISELAHSLEELEVFEYILKSTPYRTLTPKDHHLQIMGPLEARLTQPKVVIIADLNEGDWPISTSSNPWLHSKLRDQLGLPNSAQLTGVSSKVLLSLLGCQTVYLCRTTHQNNQPTQPSRWWERLKIIGQLNRLTPGLHSLSENPSVKEPSTLNSFRIPPELIPKRISISTVHLLINNPTEFFLNCILKLEPLAAWETPADLRDKGIIIHKALEVGLKQNMSVDQMITYALNYVYDLDLDPHEHMFWKAQITEQLYNFHNLHQETQPQQTWTEVSGEWTINTQFGSIVIVGKADRIDVLSDGSLHIIDYKTGTPPSKQSVYQGLTPQLPLLGIMAARGCFKEISSSQPFMVSYWDLKEGKTINFLFDEIEQLEREYVKHLEKLLGPSTEFDLVID